MRRRLKNYTTEVPANRSIGCIQELLVSNGASGILMEYEPGNTGRLEALSFKIALKETMVAFRLPLRWREAQRLMQKQGIRRMVTDDHAYRVAWRVLHDWVDAQMAMKQLELVDMVEVFLPYAIGQDGRTMYEKVITNPGLMLGNGR